MTLHRRVSALAAAVTLIGTLVPAGAAVAAPKPGGTIAFKDMYGVQYTVRSDGYYDPAQGAYDMQPEAGHRFVAVLVTVTNRSQRHSTSDDANNDMTLVGANDQTYMSTVESVTECTDFDAGEYHLAPGESATGCVAFQLPATLRFVAIKWSPGGGMLGEAFGEWKVTGDHP
ncbi:MAG TPA: DUF4352 domain-containing protein [Acidimicrobiales bacterium]|nr:DUF4352 domain-containing protein [Acidimicrobiales bacterium]